MLTDTNAVEPPESQSWEAGFSRCVTIDDGPSRALKRIVRLTYLYLLSPALQSQPTASIVVDSFKLAS
jgi:hypothetical protein